MPNRNTRARDISLAVMRLLAALAAASGALGAPVVFSRTDSAASATLTVYADDTYDVTVAGALWLSSAPHGVHPSAERYDSGPQRPQSRFDGLCR